MENILRLWKALGKTVIVAEHRLDWLRLLADRVLYFKDGIIEQEFTGAAFFENHWAICMKWALGEQTALFRNA